jgi:hypothetical protein
MPDDGTITAAQARDLAAWLHGDQTDFGGQPYLSHLDAVAANLGTDASDADRRTAYLHDTLEDVSVTDPDGSVRRLSPLELAGYGVPDDDIRVIALVTRDPDRERALPALEGESPRDRKDRAYFAKTRSIIDSGEPLHIRLRAIRLKKADNRHNSDPSRDRFLRPDQLPRAAALRRHYATNLALLDAGEAMLTGQAADPGHAIAMTVGFVPMPNRA